MTKRPLPRACPNCGEVSRPLRRNFYKMGGTFAAVASNPQNYLSQRYMCPNCRHMWPVPADEVQL